jgi:DNA end-binding protein Ku
MTQTGKVAIGRFVLRTKQYLATLRARDGVLVLATMLFDDEVVAPENLEVPTAAETAPSKKEVAMATQLVESLSAPFEPDKYTDDYREKVLALIEAKADGEIIAAPEAPAASAPVVDLMEALEASLAAARKKSA